MRSKLFFILKISVSILLLYLIFSKIDLDQLSSCLEQGNIFFLGVSIMIGVVFNLIKFMKWHYLIKIGNPRLSYFDATKSYMIGNSLGLVTPMRAGELGRALYFKKEMRPGIMGLTVADRFAELSVIFFLAIGGSFVLIGNLFGSLVVFLFILSLLLIYSPNITRKKISFNFPDNIFLKKISKLINAITTLTLKQTSLILSLSFLAFILIIIEFYYLVSAFENVNLTTIYLIAPLITISTVLPISIMGLGVREGLSVFLLAKYGISPPTALSAAFLLFVINNLTIGLIGIVYLSKTDIDISKKAKADP